MEQWEAGKPKVEIEEYSDAFSIIVNGQRFYFDQEDTKEGLVEALSALGIDATYKVEC